ncbi:MAG: protein kinase [Gemmatimonadales bacterium]
MSPTSCPQCSAERPADAAFCPGCGYRFPGATSLAAAAGPRPTDLSHQLALALGEGYQVRGLVGSGGFADVYEVFDRGLNRRLAVKVLRPDVAWSPGMLQRFKEECRVLAALNHPNILPIHFVGEGQGLVYYVMPYVEGQSLGDYLRTFGALDPARALDLAVPVLEALGHAHGAGLLHRDIKPENVMIDHGTGRALLVDFGIAKRLDQAAGQTQTGFVVGTPQYMSPEQALGQTQLDARSDIYSAGAMLFQMVTGAPPYDGDSSQEIVGKHIGAPVPQPVDRDARIPLWLSDVIVRCMAKRPVERYQSVAQLLDAIRDGRARGSGATVTAGQVAQRVSQTHASAVAVADPAPAEAASAPPARGASPRTGVIAALVIIAIGLGTGWVLFGRPITLDLKNGFGRPLAVVLPSGDSIRLDPGEARNIGLPSSGFARLVWSVAPDSGEGGPQGVPLEGEVTLQVGRGGAGRTIGLGDSHAPAFEPLITNETGVPIRLLVNVGLQGAVECHCVVEPGAVRRFIGFYPLFGNSTVRAIGPDGRSATFRDLGPSVDRATGQVGLRFGPGDLR